MAAACRNCALRKAFSFVLFHPIILLSLSLVVRSPSAPFQASSKTCNREGSREVKRIISRILTPKITAARYTLPEECPLNTETDIFRVQEEHKSIVRNNVWRCDYDGKVFRGEEFIDAHMDKRHAEESDPDRRNCLSDLCGPLHCDYFAAANRGVVPQLRHTPCHPGTMDIHRTLCQDVAHQCFPPHAGRAAEDLHAYMLTTFCRASTCRWQQREEILKPLAKTRASPAYLRLLLAVLVCVALLAMYLGVFMQWNTKTASRDNSIMRALGFQRREAKLH